MQLIDGQLSGNKVQYCACLHISLPGKEELVQNYVTYVKTITKIIDSQPRKRRFDYAHVAHTLKMDPITKDVCGGWPQLETDLPESQKALVMLQTYFRIFTDNDK